MKVSNPLPMFYNSRGEPLDAGYVYIGEPNADPEVTPLDTFFDAATSIPAVQPLRTLGGYIVDGATPMPIFIDEDDHSIRVKDADGDTVLNVASVAEAMASFQPLDSDLTAIAALSTSAFGRALLALANQAALQAAVGLPDALAAAGGTVTGAITRGGAGGHLYHGTAGYVGKVIVGTVGAGNPSTADGEIWLGV